MRRDCSAPFHISPYQGKYVVPAGMPDGLALQKLMAGMAERGASAAVVEASAQGLAQGRWVTAPKAQGSLITFLGHAGHDCGMSSHRSNSLATWLHAGVIASQHSAGKGVC